MDQEKNSFYSLNRLTFFNLVHVCATSQLCITSVAKRHFGTKLWAKPQDVFGIAGSTWSRSLLSKDFARKSLDNNDRDQVEPAIPKTSCGLARSFVPKWRPKWRGSGGLDVGHGEGFVGLRMQSFFYNFCQLVQR